jgi:hypothetical protein
VGLLFALSQPRAARCELGAPTHRGAWVFAAIHHRTLSKAPLVAARNGVSIFC